MSHLLRAKAPITDAAWEGIDEEARERLAPGLAARRVVDFGGPHGWEYSATSLGRIGALKGEPVKEIVAAQRVVLPLVELRAPFTVSRAELRDVDRGAQDIDYDALDAACERIVVAENRAVFHGFDGAGIGGIAQSSDHPTIRLAEPGRWVGQVAEAVSMLLSVGLSGPYGLVLGPDCYTAFITASDPGGYPLIRHLREIVDGPVVWAPGVSGAVVLSLRGGDFLFESGEDLSVGYDHHDENDVHLYIEESFSFRVVTPEAAVPLAMSAPSRGRRR